MAFKKEDIFIVTCRYLIAYSWTSDPIIIYFKKTKPSNENQYQKSYTLLPGDSSIITQLFGLIILQLM